MSIRDARRRLAALLAQQDRQRAELEAVDTLISLLESKGLTPAERARAERAAEVLLSRPVADEGWTSPPDDRTMTSTEMEASKLSGEERRRLGIAKALGSGRHPFPRALYSRGTTVSAWARTHGLDRNAVKSWYARGSALRPIPLKWAEKIAAEFGLPANQDTWKGGVRQD